MQKIRLFFKKIADFFSNIRFKVTAYMFIPTILLLFGIYVFVVTNVEQNKSHVQANYMHTLQSLAKQSENDIESIINFIEGYTNNTETMSLLNQSNPDTETAINIISKINKELSSRFQIVDSVFLYNKQNNLCVTSAEGMNSTTFFNDVYVYDNYSSNYWKKYNYFYSSLTQHHSLSPSLATVNGQIKYIQPLVFLQINDVNIKNFLIINISFESIINRADQNYNLDEKILILNNSSGEIFDASTASTTNILDTDLYKYLLETKTSFDYTLDSTKYFVVSHSNTNTISGYTYYSMIPYKTLYAIQLRSFLALFILLCFLVLTTIIITLKISKLVALPLESIIIHSKPYITQENEGLFRAINSSIDNIFAKTENYNKLLPYMHEKYLIDFLNSNENTTEMQTQELLTSTLPFDYQYFAAVIVQLYPLSSFYTRYNSDDAVNIQNGFYTIVKELFIKDLNSYIINSEKNTLYIVVNTKNPDEDYKRTNKILSHLNELLQEDLSHVALMFGIGSFYEGLPGLKKSHYEALNLFNSAPRNQPEIKIATPKNKSKKGLVSYKFENGFSNALTTYDYDTAISMFNDIVKKNEHLDENVLKNIYSQILYIISKVLLQKNNNGENSIDYKSIFNILDKPVNEIKNEILVLLSEFKADYNLQNPTAMNIIAYLQNNYQNSELSLENVASTFSISKTYVSAVLKNHLGITFKEYLTSIRIDEAKKILSTTDTPISDVVTMTGFSNKQTFSRVFKATTNMTALEYRKKHK